MKDNLEYKILKYLSEDDIGEHLDVSLLHENQRLLKRTLTDLKKEKLISYETGINLRFTNGSNIKLDFIRAKITFKGKEYLTKTDSNNRNITNTFNNWTIKSIRRVKFFKNRNQTDNPSKSKRKTTKRYYFVCREVLVANINTAISGDYFVGNTAKMVYIIYKLNF